MGRSDDIQEIMEVWARYRMGRENGGIGWPSKVILGKLQDGMPGTGCPACGGTGKAPGTVYGIARKRIKCPRCNGEGKVKLDTAGNQCNPAYIMPTGRYHADDDPRSQRVDWLVCTALTEYQRTVVMATYTTNGSQDHKARKMGVSQQYFSVLLGQAHTQIMRGLDNT